MPQPLSIYFNRILCAKCCYSYYYYFCHQTTCERQQKDKEMLDIRFQKMQSDFELQLSTCDTLNTENQNKTLELKVCNFNLW